MFKNLFSKLGLLVAVAAGLSTSLHATEQAANKKSPELVTKNYFVNVGLYDVSPELAEHLKSFFIKKDGKPVNCWFVFNFDKKDPQVMSISCKSQEEAKSRATLLSDYYGGAREHERVVPFSVEQHKDTPSKGKKKTKNKSKKKSKKSSHN